jgi:uncharacterized protein YbbC (DUF1343 family)/CubicO group peptidase (beta-lactamase class C family)
MMISRSSTVMWALVLFAVAVYSVHAGARGHVVEVGLSIASVAYGALLGVFLLGTLTRYATQTGAIVGMICGFALNLLLWLHPSPIALGPVTVPHVAFTWYVLIGSIVTFAIGSIASVVFPTKLRAKEAATVGLILLLGFGASGFCGQLAVAQAPVLLTVAQNTGVTSGNAVAVTAPDFSAVTTLMTQAVAAKKLPGAVVLINHDGRTVFERAYGDRALEPVVEPMTEDTIFDMASLTKCLVTATAVMQLYELHKLSFDDPAAKYLPAFAANGKQDVTIRELLTHYSGLPPDISLKDSWGLAAPDKAEGLRRAFDSPLVATPGTHFEYSDINFITLGALVEKISGEPLDVYAQEHIFTPLKMIHTRYLPVAKACGTFLVSGSALIEGPTGAVSSSPSRACEQDSWKADQVVPRAAPTAYDNEGSAATNPNFDHLLKGTVHDPTTRRMGGVAGHAGVFSTADDVALFGQALVDRLAGRPSDFPLQQATLQLMTHPEQPATAELGATIFTPDGQPTKGIAARGFGWDINSAYSRPRGAVFPIGSFGHTGFTGTSLWMDPGSDTVVVLLANAVHPRGNPPISALRGQVATAAAEALKLYGSDVAQTEQASGKPGIESGTLTGIDVLEATNFSVLRDIAGRHGNHLRIGLLTNQTGIDREGRRTIDILNKSIPEVELKKLFSPEHGLFGAKDSTKIGNETDPATHLPVISLYGAKDEQRRPSPDALKDLDAVVIDLQDAGVRFYTYETVVGYFLEAAARAHIEIIVLDRPDLINGVDVQGPVSDAGAESYIDYMPVPVRHGLTLGELALYFNSERRLPNPTSANIQAAIKAQLTVVPMQNWRRSEYFDETRLPWTNPSPNLRNLTAATLYPGLGMLDATNVSVGRGTDKPFEQIGAAYIDAPKLAAYLTARKIPGVSFTAINFAVADDSNHYPFHGKTVPGIAFTLTDRNALDAPELGVEVISALHQLYPEFALEKTGRLIVNVDTARALNNKEDPHSIAASWADDLAAFRRRRESYLLYK